MMSSLGIHPCRNVDNLMDGVTLKGLHRLFLWVGGHSHLCVLSIRVDRGGVENREEMERKERREPNKWAV